MHGVESNDVLSLLELIRFRRMQLENYWSPRKDNFYINIKNKTYDTPQNVFELSFRYKQNIQRHLEHVQEIYHVEHLAIKCFCVRKI